MLGCAITAAGCDRTSATPRANPGDTTIVFTKGDGKWGAPFDAAPALSVPATTKETTLGQATALAARRDGGVVLFDLKGAEGRIVRSFDSTGKFERNYGRYGGGPGEYNETRISIAEAQDGAILVRDGARAINRYARDGRVLNSFALGGRDNRNGMVGADDGSILTFAGVPPRTATRPGLATVLRLDTLGRVLDSLLPPSSWVSGQAAMSRGEWSPFWYPLPDGRAVIGRADRLAILIMDLHGKSAPLIGEVPGVPVPLPEWVMEERRATDAATSKLGPAPPGPGLAGARTLPLAVYVNIDVNRRIWLLKRVPPVRGKVVCTVYTGRGECVAKSSFRYQLVYLVFQPNGEFLGEVRFPLNIRGAPAVTGDFAWGIAENEDGEELLVKYRIRR